MPSLTRQIVNAAAKEIRQKDFGSDYRFEVATPFLPRWTKDQLKTLKISVINGPMEVEPADRNTSEWLVNIDVVIQQHLENIKQSERDIRIEILCALVEDMAVFLRVTELTDIPTAQFESCNIEPLFDADHLEGCVFTGRVAAKYRILVNG